MLKQVTKGSKEELYVDISDRSGGLTTLSGVKFEVYDVTNSTFKVGNGTYAGATAGSNTSMTAIALVDHNTGGTPWTAGDYALYIWFQVGGANIRKGPFYYSIVD